MADRDNFSESTKRFVALRAGHQCSFRGCSQRTVGPSDESTSAVTNIGEAAHICAASRGGKRYVESMTPEERSHIDNAIWLCANHARLIDRDDSLYTIECLREMKRLHEAARAEEVRRSSGRSELTLDLIAVGPDIVCTGELLGVDGTEWSIHIRNFAVGDFNSLIVFIEQFPRSPCGDRYILVNALGDGRVLTDAPIMTRNDSGYFLRCRIAPSFPRIKAELLGSQWAISPQTGDLFVENGHIARVYGLASLPQIVRSCLSTQRGESPFHPDYGTRVAQYLDAFHDSPWLGHLLKLEVIRQAAIPYNDTVLGRQYTPLQCVERVWSVKILADTPRNKWLPIRVDFEVKGVGRLQYDVAVFIPDASDKNMIAKRMQQLKAISFP